MAAPLRVRLRLHALNCACGVCIEPRPGDLPAAPDLGKRDHVRIVPPGENSPEVREGDHVWVEDGVYRGCILDLVRREQWGTIQYWICRRTTFPYEIRTKHVSLYRRLPCAS